MATSANNTIPQIAQPLVAKKCATVNASSPETRREKFVDLIGFRWAHQDSNLEPTDYESAALTVELWARAFRFYIL
jgi:hypothetical protein